MNIYGTLSLSQLGIIKASGSDAARFLNNQLSSNIEKIPPGQAQPSAYCSAQGRVLASLIVLQNTPDEFLLLISRDILEPTLKRLRMFVLRAKVQLEIASELSITAQILPFTQETSPQAWSLTKAQNVVTVTLPSVQNLQRHLVISPLVQSEPDEQTLSLEAWQWLNIRSGFLFIDGQTRDQFIPQMLNYESLGAIDFNKGCFPGQEVVARSQFRGAVKRRLLILHSEQEIQAKDQVFAGSEELSVILTSAPNPEGGWDALAVLPTSVKDTELTIGADQNIATIIPLPYTIRTDF